MELPHGKCMCYVVNLEKYGDLLLSKYVYSGGMWDVSLLETH